ncbi:unnamed protein product [Ectocarpus sp. CCAP 1310/34]|nr:unnamed protein product [Ectocarpus sp. CCAP 1310/34]
MPSTASNAPNGLLRKLGEWINSLLCWLPAGINSVCFRCLFGGSFWLQASEAVSSSK